MARTLRVAIAMFMTAVLGLSLNSCSESSLLGIEEKPAIKPIGWKVVDRYHGDVVFDDGSVIENQEHALLFSAEDTIKVAGTERFAALQELYTEDVDSVVKFQYNYGKVNTLTVKGLTLSYNYNGKTYELPCLSELAISGEHSTKEEVTSPAYYELSETIYSLLADGKEVLSATQIFEVAEGYVPPTVEKIEWGAEHIAFRREAQMQGGLVNIFCDNLFWAAQRMTDGTLRNEVEVPYVGINTFEASIPELIKVKDVAAVSDSTFVFEDGVADICGYELSFVPSAWEIEGEVVYDGMDFASELDTCRIEARTITFVSANEAIVKFYDKDADDYAELSISILVVEKENPLDHIEVGEPEHIAFQRQAQRSGEIFDVFCDNFVEIASIMTDGSRQDVQKVEYPVRNRFRGTIPEFQATANDKIVGNTYNFVNGVANVAGQQISLQHIEAVVSGQVLYNGKDYASKIDADEVAVRTIKFVSETEAIIRFYNNDVNDYAETTIPVSVKEYIALTDVARSYAHIAFRQNAVVANNTISVICDNKATETKIWSNGTTSKASVDYTVTNRFVYSMPMMPASAKDQTFRFNAGTAVVEGRNVNVNFSSREVSAIMFDGVDYRSEAPACEVNVATITFGEGTATITFEEGNETIVAVVPVDYIEAEIVEGEIVGMWITDAYQGRTLTSTDFHILARQSNGSYITYSRNVNETSFSTTVLTAAEGQTVLNSGKALAWAYTPAGGRVLSLVDYIKSSKSQTGYVIDYLDFNGQVLIALGDAEAALNGVPFAEPVKAVGILADGMWSITYNGTTYYFVSR